MTKVNWFYRLQQFVILVLHLLLLKWILHTLHNAGTMSFNEVALHFTGMAIAGASLIRGCAYWAKYHYVRSVRK